MKLTAFAALFLTLLTFVPLHAQQKNPVVVMDTSMGKITIELYEKQAPITVKNFLKYVDNDFYDGTIFHRVIDGFMIQGGGFNTKFKEKETRAPIKNEAKNGLSNKRGTIAMARTDNPDSATNQFFINLVDNTMLDRKEDLDPRKSNPGYAVFGYVIEGMSVVDKIAAVETEKTELETPEGKLFSAENVPKENVVIKSIRVVEK